MNNTVRFLKAEEVVLIRGLFDNDRAVFGTDLTDEQITRFIENVTKAVREDYNIVTGVFDTNNDLVAMYVTRSLPGIGGWIAGLTKLKHNNVHFAATAKLLAPALDMLIAYYESIGYYKWWMASPEQHHNLRNAIIRKHSSMIDRYSWCDDEFIPKGESSKFDIFRNFTRPNANYDMVLRMFILRPDHRKSEIQNKFSEYQGTIDSHWNIPE